MERCPVCRRRLNDDDVCGRCGADLTVLQAIEEHAGCCRHLAMKNLAAGDYGVAADFAEKSLRLRKTAFSVALSGFCAELAANDEKNNLVTYKAQPDKAGTSTIRLSFMGNQENNDCE
ncbi:hypothetical protein [Desulfomarina sp.]